MGGEGRIEGVVLDVVVVGLCIICCWLVLMEDRGFD